MEKKEKFPRLFKLANISIIILYLFFSILSVLAYGENMKEIILFSVPQNTVVFIFLFEYFFYILI